jgi:beta-xylosidase
MISLFLSVRASPPEMEQLNKHMIMRDAIWQVCLITMDGRMYLYTGDYRRSGYNRKTNLRYMR